MKPLLSVMRAGPAMTVQDLGRPGYMGAGLSTGGAADRDAFIEGVALLDQTVSCAALEMAAFGGDFISSANFRIALTGAPMIASRDGETLAWNASHTLKAGQRLSIGGAVSGTYGYLHIGGGIASPEFLQSRSAHLAAGIGKILKVGQDLPIGNDLRPTHINQTIEVSPRFDGGMVRVLPSVQTSKFSKAILDRFQSTTFTRTPRGNRQGVELAFDGEPFSTTEQLTILSEPMVSGDIQMTGNGAPFVLLPECQTTGGYPRIGTVVPDDLAIVAQARAGRKLQFRFVDYASALQAHKNTDQKLSDMLGKVEPLIRNPADMRDLLSFQLVGGVINAWDKD